MDRREQVTGGMERFLSKDVPRTKSSSQASAPSPLQTHSILSCVASLTFIERLLYAKCSTEGFTDSWKPFLLPAVLEDNAVVIPVLQIWRLMP